MPKKRTHPRRRQSRPAQAPLTFQEWLDREPEESLPADVADILREWEPLRDELVDRRPESLTSGLAAADVESLLDSRCGPVSADFDLVAFRMAYTLLLFLSYQEDQWQVPDLEDALAVVCRRLPRGDTVDVLSARVRSALREERELLPALHLTVAVRALLARSRVPIMDEALLTEFAHDVGYLDADSQLTPDAQDVLAGLPGSQREVVARWVELNIGGPGALPEVLLAGLLVAADGTPVRADMLRCAVVLQEGLDEYHAEARGASLPEELEVALERLFAAGVSDSPVELIVHRGLGPAVAEVLRRASLEESVRQDVLSTWARTFGEGGVLSLHFDPPVPALQTAG